MPGLDGPIEYKRSHNSDRNSNSVAMFQEFFSTRRPYFFHLCLERNVVNNFSFCVETTNPRIQSTVSRIRLLPPGRYRTTMCSSSKVKVHRRFTPCTSWKSQGDTIRNAFVARCRIFFSWCTQS